MTISVKKEESVVKLLETIDIEENKFNPERLKELVTNAYKNYPKNYAVIRYYIHQKINEKEFEVAQKALDSYNKAEIKQEDTLEIAFREHMNGVMVFSKNENLAAIKRFEKVQQLYLKIYAPDSTDFTRLQLENYYWHHRVLIAENKTLEANKILQEAASYISTVVIDGKTKQLKTQLAFELLNNVTLNQLNMFNSVSAEGYAKHLNEIVKLQHERYKNNVHNQDMAIKNRIIQMRIALTKNNSNSANETDMAAFEIKRYLENSNHSDKAKSLKLQFELTTYRFNNFALTSTQFLEKAQDVVKIASELYERDRLSIKKQVDLVSAQNFLGSAYVRAQDNANLILTYNRALTVSSEFLKNAKANTDILALNAPRRDAFSALAEHYVRLREHDTVINLLNISRNEVKALKDNMPEDKTLDFTYRGLFRRISTIYVLQKAYIEAVGEYEQLIEMDKKLYEADNKIAAPLNSMIASVNQIAMIYANANLTNAALEQYNKNLPLAIKAYEKFKTSYLVVNIYNQMINLDKANSLSHMAALSDFYERMDKDGNLNLNDKNMLQQLKDRIKNMKA